MRDLELFNQAVTDYFGPIAKSLELPFFEVGDGIFEVPSPYFIVRIRLHTGHARGLNVILRQASLPHFEDCKPNIQYDVGCLMLFTGEDLNPLQFNVYSDADFLRQAKLLAEATGRFAVPYMLGQKTDFETVREFMRKRGEPELERIKEIQRNIERHLPQVRQEWPVIIPPEKGEKRLAAQELQVSDVQFLGQQSGSEERILEERLVEFFKRDHSVRTAYLVRIIAREHPAGAALCLHSQFGSDNGMVEKIGAIFASVFRSRELLDIIFLTDEQEASLAKVCRPFFN